MFVLYSVIDKSGQIVFTSWHYATVMDMRMRGYSYTYSSHVPDGTMVEVISNNQATADTYRYMLRPQFRGARGRSFRKDV